MSYTTYRVSAASAPGKAFVVGEFSALLGAPALVMAVDRRLWVHTREGGDALNANPGSLLESVLAEVLDERGFGASSATPLEVDRSALDDAAGEPLGLGSSAAESLCLAAALAPSVGQNVWLEMAIRAHRRFQGGLGSAYDVVQSFTGGMGWVIGADRDIPGTTPAELPEGLCLVFATGKPGDSTRAVLARLTRHSTARARRVLCEMGELMGRVQQDVTSQNDNLFVQLTRDFVRLERQLGEATGVALLSPAVLKWNEALLPLGGVAKPSGAGGERLCVAVIPIDSRASALAAASDAGLTPLDVAIDPLGLSVEGFGE